MPESLTQDQFISLLMVGDTLWNCPEAIIPIDHETRLVALGYVAHSRGRLRITAPGRTRLARFEALWPAGENPKGTAPKAKSDHSP